MLLIAVFWCRVEGVEVVYRVTFPAGGVACIAQCQAPCSTRALLSQAGTVDEARLCFRTKGGTYQFWVRPG